MKKSHCYQAEITSPDPECPDLAEEEKVEGDEGMGWVWGGCTITTRSGWFEHLKETGK